MPADVSEAPSGLVGRDARGLGSLVRQRSVQLTAMLWGAGSLAVFWLASGKLPFALTEGKGVLGQVISEQLGLLLALVLIVVAIALTRRGPRPDIALRAPERAVARREVVALVAYGAAVTLGGLVLGRLTGDYAFSMHLPGTIYGLHGGTLQLGWVMGWALYNLVFYAAVPYLVFRRRGYTHTQLNLHSVDRRRDTLLIVVILALESAAELGFVSNDIFTLSPRQLLVGIPLAFAVNFVGTVLPVMIFIYSILLPRFARLTNSPVTTAILGGVAYALVHLFDSWTVFGTLSGGTLSVIFLFLQYFGPGMIKSVLTLRTGNAWVHVWAYHAFAPHVTLDSVTILNTVGMR